MRLNLILARTRQGVIGLNNKLPWHLPEDLAHFKCTTMGCPVIMGRKTWSSLPDKFRPLPGRPNIVLTRDGMFCAPGANVAVTLPLALNHCKFMQGHGEAWVIGGAEIYALAAPFAHRAVVTEIDLDVPGDAFAPVLDESTGWSEVSREEHISAKGVAYRFITLNNLKS